MDKRKAGMQWIVVLPENERDPEQRLDVMDLLRKLYYGRQEGSADYDLARLDAGRVIRFFDARKRS